MGSDNSGVVIVSKLRCIAFMSHGVVRQVVARGAVAIEEVGGERALGSSDLLGHEGKS